MTNGVFPCHVSSYKSYMPLTFDGGSSSLCKSIFTPGDFISRSWNGCILVQKTVATQSVDYSCLFRVMSGNARITLMVRTGGAIYLALRSSSGSVQRICQTTAVPTLGNVMHIGYSWDGSRLALSVYDTTANTLVQVVESSTNVTSLPTWTEEDGIYVGNRADLSLPYKGNIYGGTFGYGVALSGASMAREAASGNMAFGTQFVIHPQVMGLRGTGIIREPNHHDITVLNPDKTAFWNSNVPSSVIQEWWRFIPTIADIPQGAIVLDTDGVVKQKVGDYLIPAPVTIIGAGPLASAPAASVDNLGLYYLETDDPLWPSGRLWTSRRLGKFSGFDSVNLSMTESLSGKSTWKFELCGYFYSASTIYAPIYADQSTVGGGVNNCIFQIERAASTDKIAIFYNGTALRLTSTMAVLDNGFHAVMVERKADSKLYLTVDGIADGISTVIATTSFVSADIEIGGREATRYPRMDICKVNVDGSVYKLDEGTGSKVYSSLGREGVITDGLPNDFWTSIQWSPAQ